MAIRLLIGLGLLVVVALVAAQSPLQPARVADAVGGVGLAIGAGAGTAAAQEASISVSITPASGPCGTVVEVTGTGFPPGADMLVLAGDRGQEDEPNATADAVGSFRVSIEVPSSECEFQVGPRIVACAFSSFECQETASLLFEIAEEEAAGTTSSLSLTISPSSGPCGTVVEVTGSGFPPGAGMIVIATTPGRGLEDFPANASADAAGRIRASAEIRPSFCSQGFEPHVLACAAELCRPAAEDPI